MPRPDVLPRGERREQLARLTGEHLTKPTPSDPFTKGTRNSGAKQAAGRRGQQHTSSEVDLLSSRHALASRFW